MPNFKPRSESVSKCQLILHFQPGMKVDRNGANCPHVRTENNIPSEISIKKCRKNCRYRWKKRCSLGRSKYL